MAEKGKSLKDRIYAAVESYISDDMDDSEIQEAISENVNISEILTEMMGEKEFKGLVQEKIQQLVRKKLKEINEIEDLAGPDDKDGDDNFDLGKCLFGDGGITPLVKEDEDIKAMAKDKLKKLLKEHINGLDSDFLDNYDNLMDDFNTDEMLQELAKEPELKEKARNTIKELLSSFIEDNLDSESLPENFENEFIKKSVDLMLNDPKEAEKLHSELREKLREEIVELITNGNADLFENLGENSKVQALIQQALDEVLTESLSPKMIKKIKDRLSNDDAIADKLLKLLLGKFVDIMTNKIFEKR